MTLYSLTVLCALFQAAAVQAAPAVVSRQLQACPAAALWPFYHRFCALNPSTFRAQAPGSSCTGITTEANSPFGAYAAEGVAVTFFTQITNLNAVPFTLELNNEEPEDFTGGALEGSDKRKFSLQDTSPPAAPFALNNLDIQWCPDQNYFQVTVFGVTNTLRSQGSTSGSSCDVVESWSVLPPRA